MRRHWTINGRFLTQPRTGVQRYAWEIIHELDRHLAQGHALARGLEIELVAPPGAHEMPSLQAIRTRRTRRGAGHIWEQTILPLHIRGGTISLTNTGPLVARKHIVCIHDLNTRMFARSYTLPFRLLYRALIPALGRTASIVTTVSEYSASQLIAFGICGRDKVIVAPNGYEHAARWTPQHTEETRRLASRDTIVLIGSPAPHKNIEIILRMAAQLQSAGLRVALVGNADRDVFQRTGASHATNIHKLGRLPDTALAALLRDGLCLAFPSFVEGFGLPALEAMAVGCPVVASDRTSLPEVCGNAALYASPEDWGAWFGNFLQLRRNAAVRDSLIARGRVQAQHFSWSRSALTYLQAMAIADALAAQDQSLRPGRQAAE
jgi:glycosyltransferase involved in cell wall biosynthesis